MLAGTPKHADHATRFDDVYLATIQRFHLTPDQAKALRGMNRIRFEEAVTEGLMAKMSTPCPDNREYRAKPCGCNGNCHRGG